MTIPLLERIKDIIIEPFLGLMMLIALFYFVWGLVIFIKNASVPGERAKGQQHMIWGVVGLAIMVSVFGILNMVCTTVGC